MKQQFEIDGETFYLRCEPELNKEHTFFVCIVSDEKHNVYVGQMINANGNWDLNDMQLHAPKMGENNV